MCGIAGFAANVLPGNALSMVQHMTSAMARRGPDGEGVHRWPSAILGHRRLSIFDLSDAGSQPMLAPDGETGVVFNGAIYNFLELRGELEAKGYRFQSHTDTEVLIHGYDAWGIEPLVSKLRGMFAFALWDNRRRTLNLVRDRLGVKPLIYCLSKQGIAFASTVEALHQAGFVREVDDAAVLDFLEFGWIPDERAIFRDAVKLPAATILEWRDGRVTQKKYWSVPEPAEHGSMRFGEAVEATEAALLEAVRLRLFADVPVGALLSGGIDSTLVCWAIAKLNADLKAFTISTPGDPVDEGADARRTAEILGISHEIVELPPSQETPLSELISAYGEPFASQSALGMLRVSRAVKPKVTVLLTGDGGDDIFLGYPRHRHVWLAQRAARMMPGPVAAAWPPVRKLVSKARSLRRPMHFMDYATEGLSAASANADLLGYYQARGMLGERFASVERSSMDGSLSSARRLLPEFLDHEWRTQFTGEYMTKVDGATMFYGVEARSPFLDQRLWELAGALPYDVRLHRRELKAVLREIVRRRVHPEVAGRRKRGFEIPVQNWLLTQWRSRLDEIRDRSMLEGDAWLRPGAINNGIEEAVANQAVPSQLWRLVVLEHWMRQHAQILSPQAV